MRIIVPTMALFACFSVAIVKLECAHWHGEQLFALISLATLAVSLTASLHFERQANLHMSAVANGHLSGPPSAVHCSSSSLARRCIAGANRAATLVPVTLVIDTLQLVLFYNKLCLAWRKLADCRIDESDT